MALHGARASTSRVRVKFTCIEDKFPCLPEHISIPGSLTELWAHERTEAIDRTMSTWTYWGHWQNYEHMSKQRPLKELWAHSIIRPLTELWAYERTGTIDRIKSSKEINIVTMDDMTLHWARTSTSTVRIKFTWIEETFQCSPKHMSILMLRQKWIQLGDQHYHRGWNGTSWGQGIHEHSENQIQCIEETFQYLNTEAIDRTISTWAYWGQLQNYEPWAYWNHWHN